MFRVGRAAVAGLLGVTLAGVGFAGSAVTPAGAAPMSGGVAASATVLVSDETSTVLYRSGDDGKAVREIQARLRQIGWFSGDVTGHFGTKTQRAVEGFQRKRGIEVTGKVDTETLRRLESMTKEPTRAELRNRIGPDYAAPLDRRCLTGRVLCVDKTSRSLRWVVDGDVRMRLDARFGGAATPTREGAFAVYRKSRDHVSSLYGSSMPFAMFFSGGQAVHYSSDFATVGYNGASHGCVNIRNYGALSRLFDRVRVGDKVIVYWS